MYACISYIIRKRLLLEILSLYNILDVSLHLLQIKAETVPMLAQGKTESAVALVIVCDMTLSTDLSKQMMTLRTSTRTLETKEMIRIKARKLSMLGMLKEKQRG
jgi:hypothetical protein